MHNLEISRPTLFSLHPCHYFPLAQEKFVPHQSLSLQQVVDDWIDAYKENRDASLLQLMQFFINAAGCKGKITSHMQATMEHAEIIRRMTEEFEEVCVCTCVD